MSKSKKPSKISKKKQMVKFTVNCTGPVNDEIFDIASYEKFLTDRIKVNGKTGQLGDQVTIARDESIITIAAKLPFSKRYLKYLTKKFLKKQQLRDYIRVISSGKVSYDLKYFNIHEGQDEEED